MSALLAASAADLIANAESELKQAKQQLAAVNARIDCGDRTLTADEVMHAEIGVRMTEQRLRVSREEADRLAKAARLDHVNELIDDLEARAAAKTIETALTKLAGPVDDLIAAVAKWDREWSAAFKEINRYSTEVAPLPVDIAAGDGVISARGVDYRAAETQLYRMISQTINASLARHCATSRSVPTFESLSDTHRPL